MNFLFDTTAFSDLMREHPGLDAHLATISPTDDRIVICSITLSPYLSFHNGHETRSRFLRATRKGYILWKVTLRI